MIIRFLLLLIWCILVNTRYSLYHSDIDKTSYPIFDCLYAYFFESGKVFARNYALNSHLIPYCRRPEHHDHDEKQETISYEVGENIKKIITFNELKKQNVTSEQLLAWFAPIDVVEKYEMNAISLDVFYNCSLPWFGSYCQYKFHHNSSLPFGEAIDVTFGNPSNNIYDGVNGTCYKHLTGCNNESWPMCLDWRQVCDGLIDCTNGEDEQWCIQLEMTQCDKNEYRCHYGGQCIPLTFKKDHFYNTDCLDGSDESDVLSLPPNMDFSCPIRSTFDCQERIARSLKTFTCGDGQYLIDITIPDAEHFCKNNKDKQIARLLLTTMDHIPEMNCRKAFYCALCLRQMFDKDSSQSTINIQSAPIIEDVSNEDCAPLSQHCSSEWFLVIPARPVLFDLFQFVYLTNRSADKFKNNIAPDFVCFNAKKCSMLAANVVPIEIINGLTCCHLSNLTNTTVIKDFYAAARVFSSVRARCMGTGNEESCRNSSYFHCNKSMKCISYYRVQDGRSDCSFGEDELFNTCQWNDSNRFQCPSDLNKCLSPVAVGGIFRDCPFREDELEPDDEGVVNLVPFLEICDGESTVISDVFQSIETDETSCDWWPCANPYTRCNNRLNCLDGTDELNCPNSVCPFNEYECKSLQGRRSIYCLSRAHLHDKYLDLCPNETLDREVYFYNGTLDISDRYLSWTNMKCLSLDKFCRIDHDSQTTLDQEDNCSPPPLTYHFLPTQGVKDPQTNKEFCFIGDYPDRSRRVRFTAKRFGYYPSLSMNSSIPSISETNQTEPNSYYIENKFIPFCNRGVAVVNSLNEPKQCFCPPNYFGDRCQWQSQRISLTLQFIWRSTASSSVIFQVIVMLIDKDGHVTPNHDKIMYLPIRDCISKYNMYLLYPHRPKSLSNNYSIRIDFYERNKLHYWASWHLSIPFPFLPVNRIAAQLFIPEVRDNQPCTLSCGQHGKCMRYINKESSFFCQCDPGYSGADCNMTHKCNCANDSTCLSPSICVCPLYKFGSYCYVKHPICQLSNNPCQHNGFCMPDDDRISLTRFTCFCSEEYSGETCQNRNTRIDIQLNEILMLETSLIFVHFIKAFENTDHERKSLLKKIPFDQKSLTVYAVQSFNVLFVQIPNYDYYLAVLRETHIPSEDIYTEIQAKDRCPSIKELFNSTFLEYKYLRRVKYYPLLCRQYSQLRCFHDDDLMCICDLDRFSNCFSFNHTENTDCKGNNQCENGGQCFQDSEHCLSKITCICSDCYYGAKCHLSTSGFMFSLDPILGYHIKPHVSINRQPLIIKISIVINIIMLIAGLIDGCLSIVTFGRKKPRELGIGNYLLISSITSIFMMIILTYKFWELILSQIFTINNRTFLKFNCILLDVVLKILLATSDWLNACVAIERAITVKKGTAFNKKKSKESSKWVITSVIVLTTLTHIHDPIHRELIDDSDIDQQRIWCLVQYSPPLNTYNSFITLFHFLVPFSINLISAVWLIITLARSRAGVQLDQTFQQHLKHQIDQHRHLLIAPCLLILLSLPRLIISFISGCMRSARQPWLHLIGYFLSFIPSILTFVVFVLPSENYKGEFHATIQEIIRRFRRIVSRG